VDQFEGGNEDFVYGGFDEDDETPDDLPSVIPSGFGILSGDLNPSSTSIDASVSSPQDFNDDYGNMDMTPMANITDLQQDGLNNDSAAPDSQEASNSALLKKENIWEEVKPKFRQKTIPLFFARTAKRVDVAKLKENLWHKMVESSVPSTLDAEHEKENISSDPKIVEKAIESAQQDEKMNIFQEPKQFTHIVSDLDECYEEKARKDISVAFCFICVLHLANENNLKITSEGMKELVIAANS
jgi:condensin complex subunit 2